MTLPCNGQDISDRIQSHLNSGEFANAIGLAQQLENDAADQWHSKISQAQFEGGAIDGAYYSANSIENDVTRSETLGNFFDQENAGGQQGGVTAADFTNLIDLIKSTIAPDDWDDTNGDGSIQSYPAGVYVDASGTLNKVKPGSKTLERFRNEVLNNQAGWNSISESGMRKISLVKLERATQLAAARGQSIPADMKNLAGLYEIKYLVAAPDSNDIIIAGPAGPWELNEDGRAINIESGKPCLQLDDLVVCLRNAYDKNGKFGCAITPRQQNLADTKEYLATTQLSGKAWRTKLREKLGMQDIEVFGIDPQTHAGRVLVEADYRMKLIGMGLEKSIKDIPSFLSRIEPAADGSLPPMDVVRWWFTLNYDDVFADADRLAFEFQGTGVKVLSENEMIDDLGQRIHTGTSKGPTKGFANDFTDHYSEISDKYPIYRQLKNVFDMALISAIIRQEGLAERANWNMTFFRSDSKLRYQPALEPTATQVASVMNHRTINQRVSGKSLRHTLIGVSGGISFDVSEVVSTEKLKTDSTGSLLETRTAMKSSSDQSQWYWD
jgi:hypothetical protein